MTTITIQQATNELKVSRQTIYNHIKKFDSKQKRKFIKMNGKRQEITPDGYEYIRSKIHPIEQVQNDVIDKKDELIEQLKTELEIAKKLNESIALEHNNTINKIIDNHHEQVSQLNQIIQNQQVLTLQLETKLGNKKGSFFGRFKKQKNDE